MLNMEIKQKKEDNMNLYGSIVQIKGLGEKKAELFRKLGIETVYDMLTYYPRGYEDRTKIVQIKEVALEEKNNIKLRLTKYPTVARLGGNLTITKAKATDGENTIGLSWFNQPYLKNTFNIDREYIFYGKVVQRGKGTTTIVMENPEYEIVPIDQEKKIETKMQQSGKIVPVYSLTKGISQKQIRTYIYSILDLCSELEEFYPEYILKTFSLPKIVEATKNIHFPESDYHFKIARKRLVFDELFFTQFILSDLKALSNRKSNVEFEDLDYAELMAEIPFELTNSQKCVLKDIKYDFAKGKIINRLVQGDVGSGKTIIATVMSYLAIKNGYQSALMAPTEVLAKQHYNSIAPLFEKFGYEVAFLSGSLKTSEKRRIYAELLTGKIKFLIGTHAIIQSAVEFKKLGFVTTDEQHRFGVKQRETIVEKGIDCHTLVMTATPIPRTLALILYGDLDISINNDMPPNRKVIDTHTINSLYKDRMYGFYEKEVAEGRQIYVICPLVEDNNSDLISVTEHTEILRKRFPNFNIECLHGKMKANQKNAIMTSFANNEINILVSTTVIEVGINVPNATIITIENAERFGLSQLHQLRGRVGRGEHKSYCLLVSDSKSQKTKERLKVITSSNDGFYISEKDLELRGQGDFFGTRQHGVPDFKIANLYEDTKILKEIEEKIGHVTSYYEILSTSEKEKFDVKLDEMKERFNKIVL